MAGEAGGWRLVCCSLVTLACCSHTAQPPPGLHAQRVQVLPLGTWPLSLQAPEVLAGGSASRASDVFSFGVTMCVHLFLLPTACLVLLLLCAMQGNPTADCSLASPQVGAADVAAAVVGSRRQPLAGAQHSRAAARFWRIGGHLAHVHALSVVPGVE